MKRVKSKKECEQKGEAERHVIFITKRKENNNESREELFVLETNPTMDTAHIRCQEHTRSQAAIPNTTTESPA